MTTASRPILERVHSIGRLLDRASTLPPAVLLGGSFLFFAALSGWEMRDETVTNDEIVHLTAGYTYLRRNDFRLNPEHPCVTKILAAIPLLLLEPELPPREEFWTKGWQWQYAYQFLYQSGNDPDRLLLWARAATLFWGFLLLGSVYAISRDLYGPMGGFLSLFVATFFPLFLGHAHLVTSDVAVAAMMLLGATAFHRWLEVPTTLRALAAGFLLGGALTVKYSAVLLVPALAWTWALRVIQAWLDRRRAAKEGMPAPGPGPRSAARRAGGLALIGAATLALLWAAYGFRYKASPEPGFKFGWYFDATASTTVGRGLDFARRYELLPEAYLHGFWYMYEHAQGRSAYALGMQSPTGWWWYFPFATLVKTPVSALVLIGLGLWTAIRPRGSGSGRAVFLLVPIILYGVMAGAANINIGLRHLMPLFPMLIVLAGATAAGDCRPGRWARVLAMLIPLETVAAGPYFLAYFNAPSVFLADRHFLLSDSNLDWGQDLHRLKAWMGERGIPKLKLAYFGNGSPRHVGLRHERLLAANMYQEYEPEWPLSQTVQPGDWLAVSVTNYTGVVLGPRADYYRNLLRGLRPQAAIGHSILVFQIPPP